MPLQLAAKTTPLKRNVAKVKGFQDGTFKDRDGLFLVEVTISNIYSHINRGRPCHGPCVIYA